MSRGRKTEDEGAPYQRWSCWTSAAAALCNTSKTDDGTAPLHPRTVVPDFAVTVVVLLAVGHLGVLFSDDSIPQNRPVGDSPF